MTERFWKLPAAVITTAALISGGAVASEAKTSAKKPKDCSITKPHFKQASYTFPLKGTERLGTYKLKDCLGTVLVCIDTIEEALSCNWEDYNRRAQPKFAEEKAKQPLR